MTQAAVQTAAEPRRIANRYEVRALLGRGGMASVFRATDLSLGRDIALKELHVSESDKDRATITALFEREFHTLSQLNHPRVISVYDYGVSDRGPYYTMELLDGGDLRDRAPVPWREACALTFDVCSSLALLHSRRLLHRDISPRNIRCTRDGKAKLIDFGAMAAMGAGGAAVVGTPAFTPPETVHRLATDGRADLFSIGATLYAALTGHMPYPARTFGEAIVAWNSKPLPPSSRVADIPPALDELVLSLLSIEPSFRPPSAYDVMQRLAAIADLPRDESAEVSAAYLTTPTLVGRDTVLDLVRVRLAASRRGSGGALMIRAETGFGRTRMLDACVLEAKTQGATVLRATASGEPEPLTVARALTEHLLAALPPEGLVEAYPEIFSVAAPANENDGHAPRIEVLRGSNATSDPERIQQELARFILTVSRTQPLVVAVDDVQRIDSASAALLAVVIDRVRRGSVFVVLTADSSDDTHNFALEVLSRRCAAIRLAPLNREQTRELLSSVFGEVANLDLVTDEIHLVALGSPHAVIGLAEHLVDRKVIRYTSGTWTLPATLSAADLPRSATDALRAKLSELSLAARWIAEAHSLSYRERFTGDDYRGLRPDADVLETDHAVAELIELGVITHAGSAYTITNRLWTAALRAGLDAERERSQHLALATLFGTRYALARIYHLFEAREDEAGLTAFYARHHQYSKGLDPNVLLDESLSKLVPTYQLAIRAAIRLKHPKRGLNELRRWATALSVVTEGSLYWETAPDWLAQLKHDSGLDLWHADTQGGTPAERLTRALQGAFQRYQETPEAERAYPVDEAIRLLAEYVVITIASGARAQDAELCATLPPLLEPFAGLSPLLEAIWQNSIATKEAQGEARVVQALERWVNVLKKLDALAGQQIEHLDRIRNAVAYAIGSMEAQLGFATAAAHAARLEEDPQQKVNAINLKMVVRLQQGDWAGADRLRREAELSALHLRSIQMFKSLVMVELNLYIMAGDLTGIRYMIEEMRGLAARFPSWSLFLRNAEAFFELTRGDHAAALRGFEECLSRIVFRDDGLCNSLAVWMTSQTGRSEALLGLGRFAEARDLARAALAECERREVVLVAAPLVRALARAETKLGDYPAAAARIETLIESQTKAGVVDIHLGQSFEARARIAIWAGDYAAFENYSRLAAREYRRGANNPLGARYERLVDEARRAGFMTTVSLSDFEPTTAIESSVTDLPDIQTAVLRAMTGANRVDERAKRALRLVCEARAAVGGHLYLIVKDRPEYAASYGAVEQNEELGTLVSDYVQEEQARADTMTEIATGTLLAEQSVAAPVVHAAGTNYELMLLTCVVRGEGVVAGVAAVAQGERHVPFVRQTQLLSTLAAHLIQAGDVSSSRYPAR